MAESPEPETEGSWFGHPVQAYAKYFSMIGFSQPWHHWHFDQTLPCYGWLFSACMMFSIIPGLYSLDASSTPLLRQPKLSSYIAQYPLGVDKITLDENHCFIITILAAVIRLLGNIFTQEVDHLMRSSRHDVEFGLYCGAGTFIKYLQFTAKMTWSFWINVVIFSPGSALFWSQTPSALLPQAKEKHRPLYLLISQQYIKMFLYIKPQSQ